MAPRSLCWAALLIIGCRYLYALVLGAVFGTTVAVGLQRTLERLGAIEPTRPDGALVWEEPMLWAGAGLMTLPLACFCVSVMEPLYDRSAGLQV